MVNVETILADKDTANIIRNIYPLYLYDLSEIYGNIPNKYGIYEDESVKTLDEQYHIQDVWFKKQGELFPFIIFVDKNPAGFILVSNGKFAPKNVEYYVHEFFLMRPYRRKNIAEIAAKQVFNRFQGKWEVYTNGTNSNKKGQAFWNKTINNYTLGNFEKTFGETFDGKKLIFKFGNKK
ncbi:GNAT family N-acetyltransferase [Clostridium ihumii]|uniref:GNAT family N-acetyltransferase n=1 Tax=Clostridium ihumii TaxID=1470356 RepID=UPI003D356ACB